MSHNYGDGGFWFTQPAGNGYSGAHSFGGVATTKPSYLSGPPQTMGMRPRDVVKSAPVLQQRKRMIESRLATAVAQLEALPAGSSPQLRVGLEQEVFKLQQKLAALIAEIEALSAARAQDRERSGPQASPGTASPPFLPSYMEGEAPGSDLFDVSAEDGMVVSEEVEEPSGVMAWVEDNKLLAAGLGAVVGFFGYRHGKSKGWF